MESGAKEKRIYEQAVSEQRGNFTPLVMSVDGLLHREVGHFLKRLAANLAHKWEKPYSQKFGTHTQYTCNAHTHTQHTHTHATHTHTRSTHTHTQHTHTHTHTHATHTHTRNTHTHTHTRNTHTHTQHTHTHATHTAPQHLVCRVVPSLHINHMQMSIIEVFICRRLQWTLQ